MVHRDFNIEVRFFFTNIDFYSALEIVKQNKRFFNNSLDFSFDKDRAREMIRRK